MCVTKKKSLFKDNFSFFLKKWFRFIWKHLNVFFQDFQMYTCHTSPIKQHTFKNLSNKKKSCAIFNIGDVALKTDHRTRIENVMFCLRSVRPHSLCEFFSSL